ncbi:MAG: hypothetical protein JSV62_04565, partial [Promethearchaeota archaeon]
SQVFQLRGFSISELNLNGNIEIIFQKGIGITLTRKIIDLYKIDLLKKRQGYVKDNVGNLTVYINFFERKQEHKLLVMYIDKTENLMNYTNLYHLSKVIYNNIGSETSISEIRIICERIINIPKAKGLIGIFIIDKAGFLYFSKVNENKPKMANNDFQIAGFISAILIYSQDFIAGEEYGLKLEDVNLGGYHLFLKTKNNVIFAYVVDNNIRTENIKRYMQLIVEEFLDSYYSSHVVGFKGDLSPFHDFESVIDQYFEI